MMAGSLCSERASGGQVPRGNLRGYGRRVLRVKVVAPVAAPVAPVAPADCSLLQNPHPITRRVVDDDLILASAPPIGYRTPVAKQIHDFTFIESVFSRRLQTVNVRYSKPYASGKTLVTLGGSDDVEEILRSIFKRYDVAQEHFVLLILDFSRDIVGFKLLASGTETSVLVDKKIIFRNALLLGASSVILAHNHPSGNLTPSPNDLELTASVVAGGRTVDIDVLDHYIIGPNGTCASIKEQAPHIFPIPPLPEGGD